MKKKNDCKIVQDLLPNYIDKLTSKETNAYIEEHINECKECKKILDIMQKELPEEDSQKEKKKVKYIKKYNHKLRILKLSLLSSILILVILFVAFPGRNMIILTSLHNRFKTYEQNDENVYVKTSQYDESSLVETREYYCKDNIEKLTMENFEKNYRIVQYIYPDQSKEFTENMDGKTLEIQSEENKYSYISPIDNILYLDSLEDTFLISTAYKITTGNVDERECYVFSAQFGKSEAKSEIYIEKETGLVLQVIQELSTNKGNTEFYKMQYEYSFNTVSDEDMQEPDVTEYRLIENN